jgi:hypothetical protein
MHLYGIRIGIRVPLLPPVGGSTVASPAVERQSGTRSSTIFMLCGLPALVAALITRLPFRGRLWRTTTAALRPPMHTTCLYVYA